MNSHGIEAGAAGGQRASQASRASQAEEWSAWTMPAVAAVLVAAMLYVVRVAHGWPLVHDAPLMHYVVFLMDRGWAPYRDIVEMNMPGTYVLQWVVVHTLGGGSRGWWLWDTASGVAMVLAGAWITGPGRRAAGVAGGAWAYLFHMSNGAWDLGQRDWVMAVILMVALGFLFAAMRDGRAIWMLGFGLLAVTAATIKPPMIVIAVLLLWGAIHLVRRQGRPVAPLVAWTTVGAVVPCGIVSAFLLRWGVTRDFVVTLRGIVPWYASLHRISEGALLEKAVPTLFVPLLVGATVLFALDRGWRRWESLFLLAGTLCGTVLFMTQGKGWSYHLGVELACLSLWAMLQLERGLREGGRSRRVVAWLTLAVLCAQLPGEVRSEAVSQYPMVSLVDLQSDLQRLGGATLSGHVQCLDMTLGSCINALYRMRLEPSTGFIYGYYLFPKTPNDATRPLQERFLREMKARPPKVIVLSADMWPEERYGYDEVANFPAFATWFTQNYRLEREEVQVSRAAGYRIYVPKPATVNLP